MWLWVHECSGRAGEFPKTTIKNRLNHPQVLPIDNNCTRNQETEDCGIMQLKFKSKYEYSITHISNTCLSRAELGNACPPIHLGNAGRQAAATRRHENGARVCPRGRANLPASCANSPRRPPRFASSGDHRRTGQASPQQERGEGHARAQGRRRYSASLCCLWNFGVRPTCHSETSRQMLEPGPTCHRETSWQML